MKTVVVDIDNVLAATDAKIRELIRTHFGVVASQDQIISWNYHESLPISPEDERFILHELHTKFCTSLEVVPGAPYVLSRLHAHTRVIIATQRPEFTREATVQWLAANDLPYDELLFLKKKVIPGARSHLIVEDSADNAYRAALAGVLALLLDYPWNRNLPYHPALIRVLSWGDVERVAVQYGIIPPIDA